MAAKKKAAKSKTKATAKPVAAKRGKDPIAQFITYAQANPAVAVGGIIGVLVAIVLLFKQ